MDDGFSAVSEGMTPKALLQAERRNRKRFSPDFMFSLTGQGLARLRSQSVTSTIPPGRGGRRYQIVALTEQGVAMLSSVLRSDSAIRVNIEIMRAFVRLRRAAVVSQRPRSLIEDLPMRVDTHDVVISDLVESIRQIVEVPAKGRARPGGFTADVEGGGISRLPRRISDA